MPYIGEAEPKPLASPEEESQPDNPGGFAHVPALDGVRGLAILMVLFYHLLTSNPNTGNRLFDFVSLLRECSYTGVNLFFALSGFLITGILLDTVKLPHFFRIFYARRALRIFPLYYGCLLFLLLLTRLMHFVWNNWQYYYLTYTSNLVLWHLPPLILPGFNINHFWSLQVEEQFYLIWPFLIFRIRQLRRLIFLSLILGAIIFLIRVGLVFTLLYRQNPYVIYSPTFSCADSLLFGCCLCMLLRTSSRDRVLRLAPLVFAGSFAILAFVAIRNHGLDFTRGGFIPTFGFTLFGITSASLIAMTLRRASLAQRIFQTSSLRFFGKYSYGIYVFHYSISAMLTAPLRTFFASSLHSKALGVILPSLINLAVILVVSLLSYHLYESKFLHLKRYFRYAKPASGRAA